MLEINLKVTRLRRIELRNLLPFGPKMEPLALENLNILIGPNGSGKSNLIEAIAMMRDTPRSISSYLWAGGGLNE